MNFKVLSILGLVVLVCVFTTTANPVAEEHVSEVAEKSEHASEDHHAAAGKADAAHSHHVKKVKDAKKHEPSHHADEAKAAHHKEGSRAPKVHHSKKTKHVPKAVEAAH